MQHICPFIVHNMILFGYSLVNSPTVFGKKVTLSMRAEAIVIDEDLKNTEGTVIETYVMGKEVLAYVELGDYKVRAYIPAEKSFGKGQKVTVGLKKRGVFVFDAETGARLA